MITEDTSRGRYYTPELYSYPPGSAPRVTPGFILLGNVEVGAEVRWYRYWRFDEHRFNAGYVLEHLRPRYLDDPGVTRFAVTLASTGRVLVVPMCSGLRIRLTQGRKSSELHL